MSVVVITGASSGFGLQGVLAFARKGDTVFATMRDTSRVDGLQKAADRENLSFKTKTLDVTRPETFAKFVREVIDEAGAIDVLINNAGILRAGTAEDTQEDLLRLVMETNFFGPILLTQAVLPYMRARKKGYIIMVSSLSGIAGLPGDFAYTSSKFALEGATESMRHEVDRWGIRVALIEAGMYRTDMLHSAIGKNSDVPKYYDPESPYRPLIESRIREIRDRLPKAFDPEIVGELFVRIESSDGRRFRWTADPVAENVLRNMFGQDDTERDRFLTRVSGSQWWSEGKDSPDEGGAADQR